MAQLLRKTALRLLLNQLSKSSACVHPSVASTITLKTGQNPLNIPSPPKR